jgi:hypothetical protein
MGLVLVTVHSSTAPTRTAWSIRLGSKVFPSMVDAGRVGDGHPVFVGEGPAGLYRAEDVVAVALG